MNQDITNNILHMILDSNLRSLGKIATKVIVALNKQADPSEIENIILNDAALTTQVIKIANTFKTESDMKRKCLHEAIIRIGYDGLRSICICIGIIENIPPRNSAQRDMILDCLYRSFETATYATNLVKKLSGSDDADVYISGLLSNIGELAFLCSPLLNLKEYKDLETEGLTAEQACFSLCGIDYDELSQQLVEKWGLSPLINDAFNAMPATDNGKAVKVAFELTRALYSGRNSKGFIEVSKRLVTEFGLNFKESVLFIEQGIEQSKTEFNQYIPIINEHSTATQQPHGNSEQATKQTNLKAARPLDNNGQEKALDKFLSLAKQKSAARIYYSVLSDALYNYASFERVAIADVINNNELKSIAVSGPDSQRLLRELNFKFIEGKSLISKIIKTKEPYHFSSSDGAAKHDFIDDNIKQISAMSDAFYLYPIIKHDAVFAIVYMDMGTGELTIDDEQIKSAKRLIMGVSTALS